MIMTGGKQNWGNHCSSNNHHDGEDLESVSVMEFKKRIAKLYDQYLDEIQSVELLKEFEVIKEQQEGLYENKLRNKHRVLQNRMNSHTKTNNNNNKNHGGKDHPSEGEQSNLRDLPEKVFLRRDSYLTILMQVSHIQSIYSFCCVVLWTLFLHRILYDYFVEGSFKLCLSTFKRGFRGIHWVFGIWILSHVFLFAVYYAFHIWMLIRSKLENHARKGALWSYGCLVTYIASQLGFLYFALNISTNYDLPFVLSLAWLLEATRMLMKTHAFIRTNAGRVVTGKLKFNNKAPWSEPVISVKTFAYFLFVPTIVYRDHYPRTTTIRWKFVFARLLELVAVAFAYAFMYERCIEPYFSSYSFEELTPKFLIESFFGMILPSAFYFLGLFYLLLHCWFNATAEILRFGDRLFYKDWWNAWNFETFYRDWNIVVHDWLYEYLYKDFYYYVFNGSKLASSVAVITISAVFHEIIIGFALQLFLPVLYFLFGVVGIVVFVVTRRIPRTLGNILIWISAAIGNSIFITLYAMEYYARLKCTTTPSIWMPVSWTGC